MEKPQRPTFKPTLADRVLRTEPFAFATHFSPEECARRLQDLAHPRKGWFYAMSKTVRIDPIDHDTHNFDVRVKRRNRSADITHVKAVGSVWSDGGAVSYIEGRTLYGVWAVAPMFWTVGILFAVVVIAVAASASLANLLPAFLFSLLIFPIAYGVLWWRMKTDRHNLLDLLRATLEVEKKK